MTAQNVNTHSALVIADAAALVAALPIEFGSVRSHRFFSEDDVSVSGIVMDGDTVMREHIATVPFLIHLSEGHAIAHLGTERIELSAGTLLHVPAGVPLSIEALDPTRIVLAALMHHRIPGSTPTA